MYLALSLPFCWLALYCRFAAVRNKALRDKVQCSSEVKFKGIECHRIADCFPVPLIPTIWSLL